MGLASEGYQLSYRRVPLSRDRTPEAADLDTLHAQLQQHPSGAVMLYPILYTLNPKHYHQ